MNKKCVIHSSSLSSPFKLCELKSLWRRLKIKISTTSINARHECDIIKHNWILIERYSHQFSLINWTAHTHTRASWRRKIFNWQEGRDAEKKLFRFLFSSLVDDDNNNQGEFFIDWKTNFVSDCEENVWWCMHFVDMPKTISQNFKDFSSLDFKLIKIILFIQSFASIELH